MMPERSSVSSRCHEGVVAICERHGHSEREEIWRAREAQEIQVWGEGKKGRKGRPPEFYQVRVVEDGRVLWRGLTLIHVKDLPQEERDDILAEIRRLHKQGLGWIKIQKEIARSRSVYVPRRIIRKTKRGEDKISWERCGVRGPERDLELRKEIYKMVKELRSKGLSYTQIQQAVEETFGVRITKGHISYWCRDIHRPDRKVKKITLTSDAWWLIGLAVAEGYTIVRYMDNSPLFEIALTVKDVVLVLKAKSVAGGHYTHRKDGLFRLTIASRELFDLFQRVRQSIAERRFDELLKMMGTDGTRAFIRGFYDGDGSGLFVYFINADLNVLEFIGYALMRVCRIRTSEPVLYRMKGTVSFSPAKKEWIATRRDVYVLFVYPGDYERFYKLVGTSIERKVHLWRLSEETLRCHSRKFGRPYLEEVQKRFENGEDWTEVLMYLLKSVGANMRRKHPPPFLPSLILTS